MKWHSRRILYWTTLLGTAPWTATAGLELSPQAPASTTTQKASTPANMPKDFDNVMDLVNNVLEELSHGMDSETTDLNQLSASLENVLDKLERVNIPGQEKESKELIQAARRLGKFAKEGNEHNLAEMEQTYSKLASEIEIGTTFLHSLDEPTHLYNEEPYPEPPEHLLPPGKRPRLVTDQKIQKFRGSTNNSYQLSSATPDKCYILAYTGGGLKMAFQAGATLGLAEQYRAHNQKLRWDVVSGVSMASWLAATALSLEPGVQNEIPFALALWASIKDTTKTNFFDCQHVEEDPDESELANISTAVLERRQEMNPQVLDKMLCSSGPLSRKILDSYYYFGYKSNKRSILIHLAVGMTRLLSIPFMGETFRPKLGMRALEPEFDLVAHIQNTVMAASAVVGVGRPVPVYYPDGRTFKGVDASSTTAIGVEQAIQTCAARLTHSWYTGCFPEPGQDPNRPCGMPTVPFSIQERIVVDVITTYPLDGGEYLASAADFNTYLERAASGKPYGSVHNSLSILQSAAAQFPKVWFRHAVSPESTLPMAELVPEALANRMLLHGRLRGWEAPMLEAVEAELF